MFVKTVKVSDKGQISIPAEMRQRAGIQRGDDLLVVQEGDRLLLQRAEGAARRVREEFRSLLEHTPVASLPVEGADIIRRIARRHGIRRVRLFGSRARGQARRGSDLDLLVDLDPRRDLLDLAGFKDELEEALGVKVDVTTERGLSPHLRKRILREARPL